MLLVTSIDPAQTAIGIAALATLVYVVRELRSMVKETNTFFGNHMSNITKALEQLAINSAQQGEKMDKLHEDNVETAQELRRLRENP